MKIQTKVKIPTESTDKNTSTYAVKVEINFHPEPFHTRESLQATLRQKALSALLRDIDVHIDEKSLDKALAACNSIVADDDDSDNNDMSANNDCLNTEFGPVERSYEYDYDNDGINDNWLQRHYALRDLSPNDEYDVEALTKNVLLNEYYQ